MQLLEVKLPGGLPRKGYIERRARFHSLTGSIEQQLIETAVDTDRPGYVTSVLNSVLASIGEDSADSARIASLCVADRQYLMLRLAALLDGEQMWLKVACSHCESFFDVDLRRCDLPIKEAGDGYPLARLRLGGRDIEARVPTGEDQERINDLPEDQAMNQLLQDCICSVDGQPPTIGFSKQLSTSEIEAIDQALDEVSPAVCNQLRVVCPECRQEQAAELDHYAGVRPSESYLYDEIHTLASHYHWSETDILDLPQKKRRRYVSMINRNTGFSEQR